MTRPLAIFDIDGTLVDSRAAILQAAVEASHALGLPEPEYDRVRQIVGLSLPEALRTLEPELTDAELDRFVEAFKGVFLRMNTDPDHYEPLYDGAMDLLTRLHRDGWKLSLATGQSRRGVARNLARAGWADLFVSSHCAEDGPGKPDPAMLHAALAAASCDSARAIMIGDTGHDHAMAINAGVRPQGVAWGFHTPEEQIAAGAVHVATDFADLEAALHRFAAPSARMSQIPPLDPMVAARKGFRESEERLKRFWTDAAVAPEADGWVVLLDGRAPKTPAHARLVLPTEATARMVADEWAAQGEFLDPGTMPATRLAATAIDRVSQTREPVADEIAAYVGSDALCYLAEHPSNLVAEQTQAWVPWRDWAARELDVHVEATQGIVHRPQPPESLARVRDLALELDDFALTALAMAVPLFGSAILALALQRGAIDGEAAFDLSRLDEAFQERQWGVDADNADRTAARRAEAVLLDRWFRAL